MRQAGAWGDEQESLLHPQFPARALSFPMGVWCCMATLGAAGEKQELSQKPVVKGWLGPPPSAAWADTSRVLAAASGQGHGEEPAGSCSGTGQGSATREGPKVLTVPRGHAILAAWAGNTHSPQAAPRLPDTRTHSTEPPVERANFGQKQVRKNRAKEASPSSSLPTANLHRNLHSS